MRRAKKIKLKIHLSGRARLLVYRTPRHMYAQLISGHKVLASASTVEKELKKNLEITGNITAATAVGKLIAERAQAVGITEVAFDRVGYKYHGRVQAVADAAREAGLQF